MEGGTAGIGRNRGVERGDSSGEVGGEAVDANPELDDVGGRTRGRGWMAHLVAERVNGGANPGGIFGNEREFFAIDFEGVGAVAGNDATGDLPEGLGRDAGDFGEAEVRVAELIVLLDEVIGVAAAEAGAIGAELVPGEAEVIEDAGIADVFETLGAGGGATAGDGGEGVLEASPGAEITVFFAIHRRFSERSIRNSEKTCWKQGSWQE